MKTLRQCGAPFIFPVLIMLILAAPLQANVNERDYGFLLRAAVGGGKVIWGYVDHGGSSGDVGKGPSFLIDINAMAHYSLFAVEGSLLYGTLGDLKWTDRDNAGVQHSWTSKGSGYFAIFDFKAGVRLFTEPGDMGYTFIFGGLRTWSSKRDQDSLTYDNIQINTVNSREGEGNGWIIGFRDYSTFALDTKFALATQIGGFFGKAPVDKMTDNTGKPVSYPKNETFTFGYEIGAGIALEHMGLSIMGIVSGDLNATTFKDPAAPAGEESIFAFGHWWSIRVEVCAQL